MPYLVIVLADNTNQNIAIGPANVVAGNVINALAPDPLAAGGAAGGLIGADGNGDINVSYRPQVLAPTAVDLGIAVQTQGAVMTYLAADSSRPDRYTVTAAGGQVAFMGDVVFLVVVVVSPAA